MDDGCGCFLFLAGIALIIFVCAALGLCGDNAAMNAREILGK